MNHWTLNLPVPIEFGTGCTEKLANYTKGFSRALVVSGLAVTPASSVVDALQARLAKAGVHAEVFDRISAEPACEEIEEGGALARELGAEVIIGCGGGSAMDAAKAIAVAATHEGPIMDYQVGGTRQISAATLPTIQATTTSGTGSHIGRVAVVTDTAKSQKRPLASDYLYAKAAFCDPEILKLMPPRITAATGVDAFAQALESYLSKVEHPMGSICGQEAIRVISRALPVAYADGSDLDARAEMGWGDTLSAISFTTQGVLIPHVIGMVIGGRYHIPHGPAVAATTVAALRFLKQGAIPKLANVARLMGCAESRCDDELADWAINEIENLITRVGVPNSTAAYGVEEKDFRSIAEEVYADFRYRVDANPVPTDVDGLSEILKMSANMA